MINQLDRYLRHIGNCGGSQYAPTDESCICGLRQIYHNLTVQFTKMQSITRYVQRIPDGPATLQETNLNAAIGLAKDL